MAHRELKAADSDANFLDVLVITLRETPPTTSRKLHGEDKLSHVMELSLSGGRTHPR